MGYALGVDLGTTYSAAAVAESGRVEIFGLGTVAPAIPSVVVLREDGEVLVGEAADRRAVNEPTRTAREFKRRLGDPAPLVLGGTPYGAESLMAHLLRAIVEAVRERQGTRPEHVVVTHPASYGPYKKELLVEMTRLADVGRVDFLTEPEAAAINYAEQDRLEVGQIVAVYDFGGGTFDAAVLRKTPDGFEILGQPEGMERLGGIDFDQAIFAYVDDVLGGQVSETDTADPMARAALARLRAEVRLAKESLSTDTDATIPVMLPHLQTQVRLTRSEFEAMIRPRLAETVAALERAVRSAGIAMEAVARILLVGGSSRIPLVAESVSEATGRPIAVDAHPKFAIALGAARYGMALLFAVQAEGASPAAASEARPIRAAPRSATHVQALEAVAHEPQLPQRAERATGRRRTGLPIGIRVGLPVGLVATALSAAILGGAIIALAPAGAPGVSPVVPGTSPGGSAARPGGVGLASQGPGMSPQSTPAVGPSGAPEASPSPRPQASTGPLPSSEGLIATFAGGTAPGNGGDGAPAVAAQLGLAGGVAVGPDGAVYIADAQNGAVRVVRDGVIDTLVGGLSLPADIEVAPDGTVYVADMGNHRVVAIDQGGTIRVVAGGYESSYGFGGDGGPATEALLYQPEGIALHPDGSLYIADSGNNRVRRVDPQGIITTVAGVNSYGSLGDGGPATLAQLAHPADIEIDGAGNIFIADRDNNKIRRVDPTGIITLYAGTETDRFEGPADGAIAVDAPFYGVSELAVDRAGSLYANPVRTVVRIDRAGRVDHVAGGGSQDIDGLPPNQVAFGGGIGGIAVDLSTGTLYIANGPRVRLLTGLATSP